MEILRLDGLCKQYPAFRLDNVSFSMEQGTIMGLIGRNGAGKTTTLKSMLHLVHPDAGQITICGLDMDTDERAIRSRIGFVSGGASYYQRKRLRELTDVTKDFYPGWDGERYARLVRQFSLDERKRVCELSEGMIWSVVMLSPTLRMQVFSIASGSFSDSGKGLMFGPRSTVSAAASAGAAGSSIILSLTRNASGIATRGHAPQVVGSVRTPRTALTAATSGLTR